MLVGGDSALMTCHDHEFLPFHMRRYEVVVPLKIHIWFLYIFVAWPLTVSDPPDPSEATIRGRFLGSGDGLLAQPGDKDCGSATSESYLLQRGSGDGDQTHQSFTVNLPSEVGGQPNSPN